MPQLRARHPGVSHPPTEPASMFDNCCSLSPKRALGGENRSQSSQSALSRLPACRLARHHTLTLTVPPRMLAAHRVIPARCGPRPTAHRGPAACPCPPMPSRPPRPRTSFNPARRPSPTSPPCAARHNIRPPSRLPSRQPYRRPPYQSQCTSPSPFARVHFAIYHPPATQPPRPAQPPGRPTAPFTAYPTA